MENQQRNDIDIEILFDQALPSEVSLASCCCCSSSFEGGGAFLSAQDNMSAKCYISDFTA